MEQSARLKALEVGVFVVQVIINVKFPKQDPNEKCELDNRVAVLSNRNAELKSRILELELAQSTRCHRTQVYPPQDMHRGANTHR